MVGLGTVINCGSIILAGVLGGLVGGKVTEIQQDSLAKACGISTMFIATAGAMEGMIQIQDGSVVSGKGMLVVLCLTIGTLIGEILGIEQWLDNIGEWLKLKSGNSKDTRFVDAFVTASMTVCIGAMAIMGSIQDGLTGDYTTLAIKSVLDFIIILVLTSSMGKGAAFSAVPVFAVQGAFTLMAKFIEPIMNETATLYLSTIGSILIFCVGVNLIWHKKVRVAAMLPAVVLAVIAAYLPVNF